MMLSMIATYYKTLPFSITENVKMEIPAIIQVLIHRPILIHRTKGESA